MGLFGFFGKKKEAKKDTPSPKPTTSAPAPSPKPATPAPKPQISLKDSKATAAKEIHDMIFSYKGLVGINSSGLTVSQDTDLRLFFRKRELTYKICKSSIIAMAVKDTIYSDIKGVSTNTLGLLCINKIDDIRDLAIYLYEREIDISILYAKLNGESINFSEYLNSAESVIAERKEERKEKVQRQIEIIDWSTIKYLANSAGINSDDQVIKCLMETLEMDEISATNALKAYFSCPHINSTNYVSISKILSDNGITLDVKFEEDEMDWDSSESDLITGEIKLKANNGYEKMKAIKLIKEITPLGLKEAKDIVESDGSFDFIDIPKSECKRFIAEMEASGYEVTMSSTNFNSPKTLSDLDIEARRIISRAFGPKQIVFKYLEDGGSKIEAIKLTKEFLGLSLSESKAIVETDYKTYDVDTKSNENISKFISDMRSVGYIVDYK